MSAKKKSHGVLFTPYLQKGEDLLWVGMPEKNPFISLRIKEDVIKLWLASSFGLLFGFACMLFLISANKEDEPPTFDPSWFPFWLQILQSLTIPWLIAFFFSGFVRLGRTYYAISTKRLFILRQHFWKSLDADFLTILPAHHLKLTKHKRANISFDLLRRDEHYHQATRSRPAYFSYTEIRRVDLQDMSQEDAEIANELLTAVKNDMLEDRARKLGLMD